MTEQHRADAPPFRFRTPPGWPVPDADWVASHQLVVPVPTAGLPPAPSGWRFWRADRRAFRAAMPAARRLPEVFGGIGLLLLVTGLVSVIVFAATGGPAVLALVPIVAGGALYVVSCVRWWDLAKDTARHIAASGPGRDATAAGFGSSARAATGITAALAAVALLVGASIGVAPVVTDAVDSGRSFAGALGDEEPGPTYTSDDGLVRIHQVTDDDAWDATCAPTDPDVDCWSWQVDTFVDCDLRVTIGFADTASGADTRAVTRIVRATGGTTLFIAETGDEAFGGIDDATCLLDSPEPPAQVMVSQAPAEDMDYESEPDGCGITGCVGYALTPKEDCADASVQFRVTDRWVGVPDPHDLVVGVPLRQGERTLVFAVGVESFEGNAVITQITCAEPSAPTGQDDPTA